MQSMVSAGGGGGDGKSADDAGFLLWNFVWTLHAFDIRLASWAAPGRDAIFKVMDATAASIQDKLPKPFAHLWHGYCIHNSTQKISKVEMRIYDLSGLMYASWSFLHSTRTPTSAEIQSCPLMSCIQEKSSLPTIAWTTEQVASRHYTHRFWTSLLPRFWRCWRIPQRMVFFLHEFSSVLKHSFWTSWPLSTLFLFPCLRLPPAWNLWLCYLSRLFLCLLLLTGCFYFLFHECAVPFVSIYGCPLSQLFFISP